MTDLSAVPLHAFHGAGASGGRALVRWLPSVAPEDLVATARRELAEQPRDFTTAFITGGEEHYHAEFFSPGGHRIHFCGHGSLIAGWYALTHHESAPVTLMFQSGYRCWELKPCELEDAPVKLVYARPVPEEIAVPDFVAECLGCTPVAAAHVGADDDYLVLELDSAAAVRALQPDFRAIAAATRRAVIVTAPGDSADARFVFRYFAPRYGEPEDTATGSAAVQLAAWWAPRLGSDWLAVRQLSPGGAVMWLACHGNTVELAGRVGYG